MDRNGCRASDRNRQDGIASDLIAFGVIVVSQKYSLKRRLQLREWRGAHAVTNQVRDPRHLEHFGTREPVRTLARR